ncbi:hypothetical protein Q5H92_06285 [Hymenobacter sp. M29]|uniref:Uncharacterized protein n=1 Tax=Hymenobacter mellowenesis TaxID=3063995 RepID=A0ABT9A962_9BACT|nr:hypothetical protein [Hymenobacter sp. M29]MDO7845957.1 hypothetical protein [Hymenobacter sp. M29]
MAKEIEFYKALPDSIGVELEIGHIDYLEISALYLLRQLGGKCEEDFDLPVWAGKKWEDIWPRTQWGQLKARWHGWRFGTLPN